MSTPTPSQHARQALNGVDWYVPVVVEMPADGSGGGPEVLPPGITGIRRHRLEG